MTDSLLSKLIIALSGLLVALQGYFAHQTSQPVASPLFIPTAPHARYYNPNSKVFGGASSFTPVQAQAFKLAGSGVTSNATSVILSKFTLADQSTTVTMANFGSIGFGTLEPGTSREESISFTTVAQNSDGTATLGGVTRGLNFVSPYTAVTAYQKAHAGGVSFILSNTSAFYNQFAIANNTTTINANWVFNSSTLPTVSTDTTNATVGTLTSTLATVGYVNSVASSGAANATVGINGLVQLATAVQTASGTITGSTGANLVTPTSLFAATSSASNIVVVTNSSGTIDGSFLSGTSTAYRFNASTSFNGTTTFNASTTFNALNYGVMIASGTQPISSIAPGANNNVLQSNGATWSSAAISFAQFASNSSTTSPSSGVATSTISFTLPSAGTSSFYAISYNVSGGGSLQNSTTSILLGGTNICTASNNGATGGAYVGTIFIHMVNGTASEIINSGNGTANTVVCNLASTYMIDLSNNPTFIASTTENSGVSTIGSFSYTFFK